MRLNNIDFIKGLLITLVFIGHVLHGSVEESIWRSIIYSFHMPLFIGVSGYLFNANKIIDIKLIDLIKKYQFRVIFPWIIAIIIYFLLMNYQKGSYSILGLVKAFVYPFFHFWYIPAFLSWVIMTWLFKKFKLSNQTIFLIALIISLISYLLKMIPELYQNFGLLSSATNIVLYTFRPYFYLFFMLGVLYNNLQLNKPRIIEYILPIILFALVIILFYYPNKNLSVLNFFLFNASLINLVLKLAVNKMMLTFPFLEWIGLNSLGIYLWHMIPIMLCKSLIGKENLIIYYFAAILLEFMFLLIYYYLLKINFIKKYFFGL